MSDELVSALRGMVENFRPFTLRPMGGEGSSARIEQDGQIEAYRTASNLLRRLAPLPIIDPRDPNWEGRN